MRYKTQSEPSQTDKYYITKPIRWTTYIKAPTVTRTVYRLCYLYNA